MTNFLMIDGTEIQPTLVERSQTRVHGPRRPHSLGEPAQQYRVRVTAVHARATSIPQASSNDPSLATQTLSSAQTVRERG